MGGEEDFSGDVAGIVEDLEVVGEVIRHIRIQNEFIATRKSVAPGFIELYEPAGLG